MKFTTVMYLLGMFLVLLGERMIGGDDSWRWGLDGVGALCILVVLIQLGRDMMSSQSKTGQRQSHRLTFGFAALGSLSLVIYAFTTDWGMAQMGHDLMSTVAEDKQAAERYWVFTTCLWLLVWLLSWGLLLCWLFGWCCLPVYMLAWLVSWMLAWLVAWLLS